MSQAASDVAGTDHADAGSSPAAARRRTRVHVVTRRSLRREYQCLMRNNRDDVAAIVLAAGAGSRFGGPKQFARAGAIRLVDRAVRAVGEVAGTVVVVVPPGVEWAGDGIGAVGGASRSESVRRGLAHVPAAAEIVVVHDAAHPLAGADLVAAVVREVRRGADGAVPVLPTRETVSYTDGDTLGRAVPRTGLGARADAPCVPCVVVARGARFAVGRDRRRNVAPGTRSPDRHGRAAIRGTSTSRHPPILALLSGLVEDDPRLR